MILSRSRDPFVARRASLRVAVSALVLTGVVLLPATGGLATNPRPAKYFIITGLVSECNAGVRNGDILRPLSVTLHERPRGRVVAVYTVEPTERVGTYAFRVRPGTYFLSTSESTSPPPRGNVTIGPTTRAVVDVNISTTCQ